MVDLTIRSPEFQTMSVDGYSVPNETSSGRDPSNTGKFRLNLQLLFENGDEAKRWMKRNGVPTKLFERRAKV